MLNSLHYMLRGKPQFRLWVSQATGSHIVFTVKCTLLSKAIYTHWSMHVLYNKTNRLAMQAACSTSWATETPLYSHGPISFALHFSQPTHIIATSYSSTTDPEPLFPTSRILNGESTVVVPSSYDSNISSVYKSVSKAPCRLLVCLPLPSHLLQFQRATLRLRFFLHFPVPFQLHPDFFSILLTLEAVYASLIRFLSLLDPAPQGSLYHGLYSPPFCWGLGDSRNLIYLWISLQFLFCSYLLHSVQHCFNSCKIPTFYSYRFITIINYFYW